MRAAAAPAANSVAVLYFDNLSTDPANAYLADALTEEVIIRLGQVGRLAVKSRFEVQRFRGAAGRSDPIAVGRALGAAYLVTGSVQRAGDRVRLDVELVRTRGGEQVWGDVVDRLSGDLLTVESDIAREVATAITGRLLPAERSRLARALTGDPVAYEEYLRGVALSASLDEGPLREALDHFERAIARDPAFAAAYAGEASVWLSLADAYALPREAWTRAARAAGRALALDSSLTLAYAVLGTAEFTLDLDPRHAETLLRRAIALDPRGAMARAILGGLLVVQGHAAEGAAQTSAAWALDSLNSLSSFIYADVMIFGGRRDSLAAMLPRLRAVLPPADATAIEGRLRAERGDLAGARPLLDWRYYGGYLAGWYARAQLAAGDTAAVRAELDSLFARRRTGYVNALAIAKVYAALGDTDRGMEWLGRAFEERTQWLWWVRIDDELAPLRADPRYAALDRQLRY